MSLRTHVMGVHLLGGASRLSTTSVTSPPVRQVRQVPFSGAAPTSRRAPVHARHAPMRSVVELDNAFDVSRLFRAPLGEICVWEAVLKSLHPLHTLTNTPCWRLIQKGLQVWSCLRMASTDGWVIWLFTYLCLTFLKTLIRRFMDTSIVHLFGHS